VKNFGRGSIVALLAASGMLMGIAGGVVSCGAFDAAADDGPSADADVDALAADAPGLVDSTAPDASAADGACTDCATVIATSSREINWVALDATRVLWMDSVPQGSGDGDLRACPKTGCAASGPMTIFQARSGSFLTSDGTRAFASIAYGSDVGVHRLNEDGTTTIASAEAATNWLTLRDDTLYMTFYGTSLERTISTLDATTLMLGSVDRKCAFPGDGTVNTDWTVVTDQTIFIGAHSVGGILMCPKTGGDFTYFLQGNDNQHYVWSMATNDANIFWVDSADRLISCPATGNGCSPTIVLTSTNAAYAGGIRTVIHSNGDLFFETSGGDLVGCKASGCPGSVKKLAHEDVFAESQRVSGTNVAADANHIYYVARDGVPDAGATYRLMRLPRKPL
jgi:hypothetical protein